MKYIPKNIFKALLAVTIIWITIPASFAQLVSLPVELRVQEGVSVIPSEAEPYLEQIRLNCERHIGLYNLRAGLADIETGMVTAETINAFRDLIHSNSRIFNDLEPYGRLITNDEYTGKIAKYFRNEGVKFKITDLLITKITTSPDNPNLFEVNVRVNKLLYAQINPKKDAVQHFKPGSEELYTLDFTIIVQGDNLDEVMIWKIDGEVKEKPKPFNKEVQAFVSYGINLNSTYKYFNEFSNTDDIALRNSSMFDIGVKYANSLKRGGHTKFVVGLAAGLHGWSVSTDSAKFIEPQENNTEDAISFTRTFDYVNIDNEVSFMYVQGLVGLNIPLRPILGYKMEYWIEGLFMPTYISKSGSVRRINSQSYIREYSTVTYRNINYAYCVEEDVQNEDLLALEESSTNYTFGVQIKPGIKYHVNDLKTFSITGAIGYTYYFGSWLSNDITSLHSDSEQPKSLFLQELTPAHLRFELGMVYKFQ
jgi:hypothetical protein